jgi:SAM-dependent methyltransferase
VRWQVAGLQRVLALLPGRRRDRRDVLRAAQHLDRVARPVRWGNLRRVRPFPGIAGRGRGTTVDRYYTERFIERNADVLRGRVLVGRSPDLGRVGGQAVSVDVFDRDPYNEDATVLADLGDARSLPTEAFDCVIVTDELHVVPDARIAIDNAWQSVSPGGSLLVATSTMPRVDHTRDPQDAWRVLPAGLRQLLIEAGLVEVSSFGNVLAATALMMGIAAEELTPEELADHDPDTPVVVCASARKISPR